MLIASKEDRGMIQRLLFRRALIISVGSLFVSVAVVVVNAFFPNELLFAMVQLTSAIFFVSTAFAAYLGIARLWRSRPDLRRPIVFLAILTSGTFLAHLYTINLPPTEICYRHAYQAYGCIMDEFYYVPAAHALLVGIKCPDNSADVCNTITTAIATSGMIDVSTPQASHPPLAFALIAAGIEIFQFGDFGWRIFPAILGTLCIPLIFAITYLISRGIRFACIAALLLALDTMFFVQSSAAVLDVPPVFFAMVGFLIYFWGRGFWKFDALILSGVVFGLAGLSKESAVFPFGALLMYHTAFFRGRGKGWVVSLAKMMIPAGLVLALGIQIWDSLYLAGAYPNFVQHIASWFGSAPGYTGNSWLDDRLGTPITPLNWLTFYSPPIYLTWHQTASIGLSSIAYLAVGYYGVTNMLMVWMVFAWVPLVVYRSVRGKKSSSLPPEEDAHLKAGIFALIWFLWGYFPYILLWLHGRITYPYYLVPTIPALALGAAYFVTRQWFTTRLTTAYITANFAWFFWLYPDKAFLPIWVRVLIGG